MSPGEAEEGQLEAEAELRPVAEPTCTNPLKQTNPRTNPTTHRHAVGPRPVGLGRVDALGGIGGAVVHHGADGD